ncbi:MAG: hypothetical protein COA52_04465 [Hyphomicrobiales bacterium]|nr:MAG: hypothetical protein COA52_04465 [Hyphomicrobiales bacterium]
MFIDSYALKTITSKNRSLPQKLKQVLGLLAVSGLFATVFLGAMSADVQPAQACPTVNTFVTTTQTTTGNCTVVSTVGDINIPSTSASSAGIEANGTGGQTIEVENGASITTNTFGQHGIRIASSSGAPTSVNEVIVNGQITTTGVATAANVNLLYSDAVSIGYRGETNVTVGANGVINTSGGYARGISYRGVGGNITVHGDVTNNGRITTGGIQSSAISYLTNFVPTTSADRIEITNNRSLVTNGNAANNADGSHGILYKEVSAATPSSGVIITNGSAGTIVANGTRGHGIYVILNATTDVHTTITNSNDITTNGGAGKGIWAFDYVDVINTGRIITTSTTNIAGSYGIDVGENSSINNTGTIQTASNKGFGMVARDGSTMTNGTNGLISTGGVDADGMSALATTNGTASNINVSNMARITTTGQNANGILSQIGNTIVNSGSITTSGVAADGIQLGRSNTVTNNGTIVTTGATSAGIRTTSGTGGSGTSTIPAYGQNTIYNYGSIRGPNGILLFDSAGLGSTVENYGDIISSLGPNGIAIRFGPGSAASNNDTLKIGLDNPDLIIGAMDMNNGDDHIILDRTNDTYAWRWTFDDFDPNATIVTVESACPATGDCLVITPKSGQVYFVSGETDFERTCGNTTPCNDAGDEGTTVFVFDTNKFNYLSDVSLDIVTSAHAAIDSRIEQAWKIHLRKERELEPDEVLAFAEPKRKMDFWFRPWVGMRHRMERDYLPETIHQWAGFLGGVNVKYNENWHFGVLAGLARSYVSDMSNGQHGDLQHQMIGAQAHYDNDKYFVDYSILFGRSESNDLQLIKNNLVSGGIENASDSPLLKGPFQSHSLRVGRRFQLHDDRWDLFLRPSVHAVYVRQTVEDIVYPGTANTSVTIDEFTTESIAARLEIASELVRTNRHGVFHSDLRMGLAMRGVIRGGGATARTVTDQIVIGAEKAGDYTYSIYSGLGFAWEKSEHWVLNLDGEADYSFDHGDFTGRIRGGANFRF